MNIVECACGTIYSLKKGQIKPFRCQFCKKTVVAAQPEMDRRVDLAEMGKDSYLRLFKWFFWLGSTVGIFVLLLMVPTVLMIKEIVPMVILLVFELVFGTLLVCASVSCYLLSVQVKNLQSSMNFHQHNLHIFADQISKLFYMLRRKE